MVWCQRKVYDQTQEGKKTVCGKGFSWGLWFTQEILEPPKISNSQASVKWYILYSAFCSLDFCCWDFGTKCPFLRNVLTSNFPPLYRRESYWYKIQNIVIFSSFLTYLLTLTWELLICTIQNWKTMRLSFMSNFGVSQRGKYYLLFCSFYILVWYIFRRSALIQVFKMDRKALIKFLYFFLWTKMQKKSLHLFAASMPT